MQANKANDLPQLYFNTSCCMATFTSDLTFKIHWYKEKMHGNL